MIFNFDDHHLVGGVAHIVRLDVVDAALLGPGEGGDRGEEEGDGQEHHGVSGATRLSDTELYEASLSC